MSDPRCDFGCPTRAQGFCSNCGAAHCDAHALVIPDGSELDDGETGLICPRCAPKLIENFIGEGEAGQLARGALAFLVRSWKIDAPVGEERDEDATGPGELPDVEPVACAKCDAPVYAEDDAGDGTIGGLCQGCADAELQETISRLPRERVVELLTGAGIQCYDVEPVDTLRAALLSNVEDGTIERDGLEGDDGASS